MRKRIVCLLLVLLILPFSACHRRAASSTTQNGAEPGTTVYASIAEETAPSARAAVQVSAPETATVPAVSVQITETTAPAVAATFGTESAPQQTASTAAAPAPQISASTPTAAPVQTTAPQPSSAQKTARTCTFSIVCSTILENLPQLDPAKERIVPSDGVLLAAQTVTFEAEETVFDVLKQVCRERGLQMEFSSTPVYNGAYIEGIGNLYEFDCGSGSGWMYRVNGWFPNYGCSKYALQDGDTVEWLYTCDLGADIGGSNFTN